MYTRIMWISIVNEYEKQLQTHGSCSACQLSKKFSISQDFAIKVISFYMTGVGAPCLKGQGHGYIVINVLYGMQINHHTFIYELYLDSSILPLLGYVEELERHFGLSISYSIMQR